MVGTTPEQLESSGSESVDDTKIREEIAPYLLLHHNYAAKPIDEPVIKKHRKLNSNRRKFKEIRPKLRSNPKLSPKLLIPPEANFDEDSNSYIIIVQDDLSNMDTNEIVIDASCHNVENENLLSVPSPKYCPSINSDCGYESIDSPLSLNDPDSDDIWDPTVGELFPSLM